VTRLWLAAVLVAAGTLSLTSLASGSQNSVYRVDHVIDGDTVELRNGKHFRLVQIDTPEAYFGAECYGPQASATTKRLLPAGTRVRLMAEPATNRIDD
jgi:endonuclease YncB( thermonuclease family)